MSDHERNADVESLLKEIDRLRAEIAEENKIENVWKECFLIFPEEIDGDVHCFETVETCVQVGLIQIGGYLEKTYSRHFRLIKPAG